MLVLQKLSPSSLSLYELNHPTFRRCQPVVAHSHRRRHSRRCRLLVVSTAIVSLHRRVNRRRVYPRERIPHVVPSFGEQRLKKRSSAPSPSSDVRRLRLRDLPRPVRRRRRDRRAPALPPRLPRRLHRHLARIALFLSIMPPDSRRRRQISGE